MNSSQIEHNVKEVIKGFDKEHFIYDLLMAYGISKTSITRLKKGDFNLSKVDGEVLYKKKVLFKEVDSDSLLTTIDYITKSEGELKYNPRFVIVTDYKTLLAKDIKTGLTLDTPIFEVAKKFDFFLPWAGQERYQAKNENDADRKASYRMAKLYDILVQENPSIYEDGGHNLNIFLSRLLFCFFAEDTNIFHEESIFTSTLKQHTNNNGSDVNIFLNRLFKVLNSKSNHDEPEYLRAFPYVNGGLFRNNIISPKFNMEARKILLECGELRWNEINPDIFGSMIQAVVNPAYRSGLGMHYTSVPNIMKVIEPLFLSELKEEFDVAKKNPKKLKLLIHRISKIKIFDPACGSGNFLIIAYKELRRLEIAILQHLYEIEKQVSIVFTEIKLSQFYGIELDDFAHEMALLSLWLAEHQMNKEFVDELHDFGKAKPILPLKEAGHIHQGNSLRIDWSKVCPNSEQEEIYILGNPPYLGYSKQKAEQKEDIEIVLAHKINNFKKLDYVGCWFVKATDYINNSIGRYAFVTTNSIAQGEQVSLLFPYILNTKQEIFFAHQSFKWTNSAKGNAGVAVVIIGVRSVSNSEKTLFSGNIKSSANNISPYLTISGNTVVYPRTKPLSNFPEMIKGSSPGDDGNLLLNDDEFSEIVKTYPNYKQYIRKYIGAEELMNSTWRYCIYAENEDIKNLHIPPFFERFQKVKSFREKSTKKATQIKAKFPHKFDEDKHQENDFILVPQTGSERRNYLPVGFFDSSYVPSNACRVIYKAEPWMFGLLSSKIHLTWIKCVAGRLKTDMQYSNTLCYNTFPFPNISEKQKEQINLHVFDVLDERAKHPEKTLSQLYDPDKMPKGLSKAHFELDLAIERCYRLRPFDSDIERLEYLFKLYDEMRTKNELFKLSTKKIKNK